MDKNIRYRMLLRKANDLLDDATEKLSDLIILRKKIKQYSIEKDYHEQILSINSNVPSENLVSYFYYQKSISDNKKKYEEKLKEISTLVSMVLMNTLHIMNYSTNENNNIDLNIKELSKKVFYNSINLIETHSLENIIDLTVLIPIIVELDLNLNGEENINQRNIRNRINKLKNIILKKQKGK